VSANYDAIIAPAGAGRPRDRGGSPRRRTGPGHPGQPGRHRARAGSVIAARGPDGGPWDAAAARAGPMLGRHPLQGQIEAPGIPDTADGGADLMTALPGSV